MGESGTLHGHKRLELVAMSLAMAHHERWGLAFDWDAMPDDQKEAWCDRARDHAVAYDQLKAFDNLAGR